VVLNPDSGRGYLSRVFDDGWMANFGFLRECDECVGAVLDARGNTPSLLYVNPSNTVQQAIDLMRANGVSQLPVCKNTPPFANAEVSGSVDELDLMEAVFRDATVIGRPVEEVMSRKLPTIGVGRAHSHRPVVVLRSRCERNVPWVTSTNRSGGASRHGRSTRARNRIHPQAQW
jgi:cystathionine beta-synthase